MKEEALYSIKKTGDVVEIKELNEENVHLGEKVCDIPRYYRVTKNNRAISWDYPCRDEDFIKFANDNLEDGEYIAKFDYEWYRGGWASGSNWYGNEIYKSN